ncbi:MAG TPA: FAD:protein FMN transferase [Ideonella sp.]|nr:FAD:protein FMN transferase [Ideonella sp.]
MSGGQRRVIVPLEISPAAPALGAVVHTLHGATMGTSWCVKFSGPRQVDGAAIAHVLQGRLDEVVAQMSPWEAGSDISRFNAAPAGRWQALPAGFAQVLACALAVAEQSGGAFDPTAGELVNLWGFGPPGRVSEAPQPSVLAAARERAGWQRLALRDEEVRQAGGQVLDLSAIAKGFGVDEVARGLQQLGFDNHLVEVGGELRGSGLRPDGQPWWVDLQTPPDAAGLGPTRLALHGLAVATSGDYLRYFDDADGVRRSHTLDPRSGEPVAHGLASVSVLHAECMWADAWSTALTVLGPVKGLALAQRLGLAALFVERRGAAWREHLSPALAAMADE